nr:hypothetical protein [Streptomyces smyrnaeus]
MKQTAATATAAVAAPRRTGPAGMWMMWAIHSSSTQVAAVVMA